MQSHNTRGRTHVRTHTHTSMRKCTSDTLQWNLCYAVCRARANVCVEKTTATAKQTKTKEIFRLQGNRIEKEIEHLRCYFFS